MTRYTLVLQHVPFERPAILGDILTTHELRWRVDNVVTASDRTVLPRLDDLSGIAILGGPMGALDVAEHPGLGLEAELIREAFSSGVPILGICLGHQLVATALGATLHPGAADEIGLGTVEVVSDDPVFGAAGAEQTVLHWHHDVVDAPDGATVLASTGQTPNQAFRIGDAVFGTQFHAEVDSTMLAAWLAEPAMANDLDAETLASLPVEFASAELRMRPFADAAFGAFARANLERL